MRKEQRTRGRIELAALALVVGGLSAATPAQAFSIDAFSEVIITRTPPGGSTSDQETLFDQDDRDTVTTGGTTATTELAPEIPITGEGDFIAYSFTEASDLRSLETSALAQADTDPQGLSSPSAGAEYRISALSQIRVFEQFTIHAPEDAPGLAGQPGTTTFRFDVDGLLDTRIFGPPGAQWDGDVESSWSLTAIQQTAGSVLDLGDSYGQLRLFAEGDRTDAQALGYPDASEVSPYVATVPFVYGEEFQVAVTFRTEADVRLEGGDGIGMLADAPFAGTATLLPLTDFTAELPGGGTMELTELTVTSGSGTDYTAPIPEPGTAALLGCGALGLALRIHAGRSA